MPAQHLVDKAEGKKTEVFARLPLQKKHEKDAFAEDGVNCSVCHRIERKGLGTPQTFNGNVEVGGGRLIKTIAKSTGLFSPTPVTRP